MIGFEVCNLGASGRTASVALQAISEVFEVHPKVVVLILGANDALRGLSRSQTKENILQMVNKLKAQGIMVVLAGIDSRRSDIPRFLKDLHGLDAAFSQALDMLRVVPAMSPQNAR